MLWNVDFPVFAPPKAPIQSCAGFFFFSPSELSGLDYQSRHSVTQPAAWKMLNSCQLQLLPMRIEESQAVLEQLGLFVAPLGRTELFGKIRPWWEAEAFWKTWPLSLASSKEAVLRTVSLIFNSQAGSVLWNSESSTNKVFSTSSQRRLEVLQKPCSSVPTSCCPADVQRPFSYQTFSQRSFFSQISVF